MFWVFTLLFAGPVLADDTARLQGMINRCRTGGEVSFPAGEYMVSKLQLKPDCTYRGTAGKTALKLRDKNSFIADVSERSGISISGLTFDANSMGGAIIAQGYAPVRNIHIDNCDFTNVVSASAYPANLTIFSSWGIIDSSFTNNRFSNVSGGISLTTVQNVSITGNTFSNVTQSDAIFIAPNPVSFPSGEKLRITGNTVSGVAKIGIEIFRPDPTNGSILNQPLIEGNNISRLVAGNAEGMGLSITHGEGAIIRNNTVDNTAGVPQENGIGIEVIVRNAQVTQNTIRGGVGFGIAVQGTPGAVIAFNTITGTRKDGILFACDNGRHRCSSTGSVVENNTIRDARVNGIRFDNDWSQSRVRNNVITRAAGAWPDDANAGFTGIRAPAPRLPSDLSANRITLAPGAPAGFHFRDIDPGK